MTADELEQLESRLESLGDLAIDNADDIEKLQNEISSLRTEIAGLRQELNEVHDMAELLTPEQDTRKSKQQRAALALSTMHRIASNTDGTHALDANGVMEANNGEIGRSFAYDVLKEIPRVADNLSVCWLVEEPRNSAQNTRVILDLTEGTIPASAGGVRIHGGVPADD